MFVKKLSFITALAFTNHASAVTYYFSANLSEAIGTIPAGTSFTGFFSYEFPQTLTVLFPTDTNTPPHWASGFLLNFGITVGSESVFFSNPDSMGGIILRNNAPITIFGREGFSNVDGDSFSAFASGEGQFLGGKEVTTLGIYLIDSGMTIFQNLELVGDTMRLNNFDYGHVYIHYRGEPSSPLTPYPTTIEMSTPTSLVPEPSSLSLLLAGGAVLMAGRRRKRD